MAREIKIKDILYTLKKIFRTISKDTMFKVIYGSILIPNYWYPIEDVEREEWYFSENSDKFKSLNIRFDKEVVVLIIDGLEEHYNSISCIPRLNELMEDKYKDV